MDEAFVKFILEHAGDDVSRLLLGASKWPQIDMPLAAATIEARRKASSKLPSWYAHPEIVYPSSLSLEQCSSQATAIYKQQFCRRPHPSCPAPSGHLIADITGGLGVDSYFLSLVADKVYYHERQQQLCEAARHNFAVLGADNIEVSCTDHIDTSRRYELIYADPARRGAASERIYSIADCQPDIISLRETLFELSDRILVKISPMADLSRTVELLPETSQIHIVSAGGECKEILLLMEKDFRRSGDGLDEPLIVAADLDASGRELWKFEFHPTEESSATTSYALSPGKYLYQPGKALLKSGAFKLVGRRFGLSKLAPSTHLYTSDVLRPDFPGKIYEIEEVMDWNKRNAAELSKSLPGAELQAINFPLDTNALRRRLSLKDLPAAHLFATTLGTKKILIKTTCNPKPSPGGEIGRHASLRG